MAASAWLVWRRGGWPAQARPLGAFVAQLGLNFAWSFLFFSLQRTRWALVDIVLLWIAIVVTIAAFARVDRRAAWLLAPYLAWVSFAVALNASIDASN
jgi:tryptophan-rich sensory protein